MMWFAAGQKLGEKAPWSVGWIDPKGKRRSKRVGSRSMAEKFQRKTEGELAAGIYKHQSRQSWADFRAGYEEKILPRLAGGTQQVIKDALNRFQEIIKPQKVSVVTTEMIDEFVAKRCKMRGRRPDSLISPASVNKELRHIKAVLGVACEWGELNVVPKFRMIPELEQIGPVFTEEHFRLVYEQCDRATLPKGLNCTPSDWWRALLVFNITTGWRIDEILSLNGDDLDLATGRIITRAIANKGKRDEIDFLPTVALEHVRGILGFYPTVFTWPHSRRVLWEEFQRIQKAAGIHLPCSIPREHTCTGSCHLYGFHALRRAYGTLNADRMPATVLQKKMRHKSFTTTQRYIELASKMKKNSEVVFVPEFLDRRQAH